MKISTNPIGNYAPNYVKPLAPKAAAPKTVKLSAENAVTEKEKEFFISKYPKDTKDIIDYHFYKKEGKMSGVSVGTLFDRRG